MLTQWPGDNLCHCGEQAFVCTDGEHEPVEKLADPGTGTEPQTCTLSGNS